jgi:hypothetical protein
MNTRFALALIGPCPHVGELVAKQCFECHVPKKIKTTSIPPTSRERSPCARRNLVRFAVKLACVEVVVQAGEEEPQIRMPAGASTRSGHDLFAPAP